MDLNPNEFSTRWDKHLVNLPRYPWAHPNEEPILFLPKPYGRDDQLTRQVRQFLKILQRQRFRLSGVSFETRFQVLNGQPGHWITDIYGTGDRLGGNYLTFSLREHRGRTVIRLTAAGNRKFRSITDNGQWVISSSWRRPPRTDPIEAVINRFIAEARDHILYFGRPDAMMMPLLLDTPVMARYHGGELFQVVGKGEFSFTPMVHIDVRARACARARLDSSWHAEEFYKADACVNCVFFQKHNGWGWWRTDYRQVATALMPHWQRILRYELPDRFDGGRMIRDRPALAAVKENRQLSVNEVIVTSPLPVGPRSVLDRRGDWYEYGR